MRLAQRTLVISRRRDLDRRERFIEQARAVGLEAWAFFDAIDAEAGAVHTSAPSLHGRAGRPAPEPLCRGEVGCLLSHLAIWRTMQAITTSSLAVLEDDVEFLNPEHFGALWGRFVRAVDSLQPLMLHLAGEPASPETEPVPVNDFVSRVVHTYGTSAMVLFPGAISLLSSHPEADTMREPADWLLLRLFGTGRVYCPREPLMRHTNAPGITPAPQGESCPAE